MLTDLRALRDALTDSFPDIHLEKARGMPTANRGRRLRRLSPVTWYAALSELPRGALKIITKDAPEEAPARFRAAQSLQLPS